MVGHCRDNQQPITCGTIAHLSERAKCICIIGAKAQIYDVDVMSNTPFNSLSQRTHIRDQIVLENLHGVQISFWRNH